MMPLDPLVGVEGILRRAAKVSPDLGCMRLRVTRARTPTALNLEPFRSFAQNPYDTFEQLGAIEGLYR